MFIMCHRIGLPPISTIGFGLACVSSLNREPKPPARMTAFIQVSPFRYFNSQPSGREVPRSLVGRTSGFEPKPLLEQPECHGHAEVGKLSSLSTVDYREN